MEKEGWSVELVGGDDSSTHEPSAVAKARLAHTRRFGGGVVGGNMVLVPVLEPLDASRHTSHVQPSASA